MGELEQRSKKRRRTRFLKHALLATVGSAGLLSLAVVAPNAVQLLPKLFPSLKRKYYKSVAKRTLASLISSGLVEFRKTDRGKMLALTPKGQLQLFNFENNGEPLKPPKRWDGKFRVVIFDIKENRRNDRTRVRDFLRGLGFLHLQHSVWVYPYPCEEILTMMKAGFHFGKDILYMIADEIEYDKPVREYFNLPIRKE